jgi:hypothetical protein
MRRQFRVRERKLYGKSTGLRTACGELHDRRRRLYRRVAVLLRVVCDGQVRAVALCHPSLRENACVHRLEPPGADHRREPERNANPLNRETGSRLCDQLLSAASAEKSAELVPGRFDLNGHACPLSEDHGLVQRASSRGEISGG